MLPDLEKTTDRGGLNISVVLVAWARSEAVTVEHPIHGVRPEADGSALNQRQIGSERR